MLKRNGLVVLVLVLCCVAGSAKDKKKSYLPADVLRAETVLVLIDPNAGTDVQDPNANRLARVNVEQALMKWGRFSLAMEASTADLIITVSKGNGKVAQPTIGGVPNNNRPVIFEPSDSTVRIGGRGGNNGNPNDPSNPQYPSSPSPQLEVGPSQDMFVVYRGAKDNPNTDPLDGPPVWRYTSKDALHSPDVPAVAEFQKLITESEQHLAGKP